MPTFGNFCETETVFFFVSPDDTITSLESSADVNKLLGVATYYIWAGLDETV